jgi:hypothetical protein
MLESFFQNMSAKMTKDLYFEMCAALGTEPNESEIPVEIDDFPEEVQEAINVYYKLRDEWDTMNGVYMGKSYTGLSDILDILEIPKQDRKYVLEWVSIMDAARSKMLEAQRPKSTTK